MFLHAAQCELDAQALWIHRKHESLAEIFGSAPVAVAHARSHATTTVKAFTAHLAAGHEYLVPGEGLTAADILFVHCCNWGESIGWADDWKDVTLDAYLARCRGRDAYKRAKEKA
mmetsp:Transcript_5239/g.16029  ORF Transcript_5239/g.16029 Transcript_5239/m.16029 type:complete len:115 (-) Transcript_5239:24-368(-)